MKEELFISEFNEHLARAIVISGDEHSVWAYCMKVNDEGQELLFHGFICSRGTILEDFSEIEDYVKIDLQPPLMAAYQNEFSIQEPLDNTDFKIEWYEQSGEAQIYLKGLLYLVMDMTNHITYTKSITEEGPYGIPLSVYLETS